MSVAGASQGDEVLPVRLDVVEVLGERMDPFVSTDCHPQIVARVDARRGLAADQRIRLRIDMARVHVFEPGEAGPNLSLADR